MSSLPDKPSELIRLALADLVKCERSKKYRIHMSDWHVPNSQCAVCLAGAVMAQTLGADITEERMPCDYDESLADPLNALNNFRVGNCTGAFRTLDLGRHKGERFRRVITHYHTSPAAFKRDMHTLAADLEEAGY
jgi:hypothetical protein